MSGKAEGMGKKIVTEGFLECLNADPPTMKNSKVCGKREGRREREGRGDRQTISKQSGVFGVFKRYPL